MKPPRKRKGETTGLNFRQRQFVDFYLGQAKANASEAARLAGFGSARMAGPRMMKNDAIRAAIDARLNSSALATREILARLSDVACASLEDFMEFDDQGGFRVDLAKAERRGVSHVLKLARMTPHGLHIELHDPLVALDRLARYWSLYNDGAAKPESTEPQRRIMIPDVDERLASGTMEDDG